MPVYLSPKFDASFKKVFGNEDYKNVTISFLNSILQLHDNKEIKKISFKDTANVKDALTQANSFVDVHCVDGNDHHFLIEMQIASQAYFIKRALYYASLVFSRQLPIMDYTQLMPVICITILDHIKFKQHNNVISRYAFTDIHTRELLSEQYLELYFIELPKFKKTEDQLETLADEWLFFMTNAPKVTDIPAKMKDVKEFKNAFHVLDKMNWPESEFFAYIAEMDAADKPNRIRIAQMEEAEDKGAQKKAEAVAINLLKMGLTVTAITQVTGLSTHQIKILQTNMESAN